MSTLINVKLLFHRRIGKVERLGMKDLVVPVEILASDGKTASLLKELWEVKEVELFGLLPLKTLRSQNQPFLLMVNGGNLSLIKIKDLEEEQVARFRLSLRIYVAMVTSPSRVVTAQPMEVAVVLEEGST